MKVIPHKDAAIKHPTPTCRVDEYVLQDARMDLAVTHLKGRYPQQHWALNEECAELAYVIEGTGRIVTETASKDLAAGDVILIEAKEKYYWEGHMRLTLTCHPAWHAAQHKWVA